MKKGIRKEAAAIVLARVTNEKVAINNGDISSLISSMQAMQQQMFDLTNALTITNEDVTALTNSLITTNENVTALTNAFNAHVHAYTDVDNLAGILNKTTSTQQ